MDPILSGELPRPSKIIGIPDLLEELRYRKDRWYDRFTKPKETPTQVPQAAKGRDSRRPNYFQQGFGGPRQAPAAGVTVNVKQEEQTKPTNPSY